MNELPENTPEPALADETAVPAGSPAAPSDEPAEPRPDFAELGLLPVLIENLGRADCRRPWPIQAEAIPPAMAGRDVIGLAPTGRGKTIAFLGPIIDAIVRDSIDRSPRGRSRRRAVLAPGERLRGLVLCPTRELAMQVARDAEMLLAGTRHTVVTAYGKVSINPQIKAIREGCDLLVATPGRLRELVEGESVSLARVRHVAVDEVDRMLDMGFLPQVRWALERLPAERRTSLFTATLPEAARELVGRFLEDPVTVEAGRHTHAAEHVREMLVSVQNHDKIALLLKLFERGHGRGTLVFCGTRRRVGWVGTALERNGVKVGQLHGDRSQRQREAALAAFTSGDVDVLVCTDVAARGLHLERVRTVVNYDVPNDPEEYVHRVGRAGHGGGFGEAITLVGRRDEEKWDAIAWSVTEPLPYTEIDGFTPTSDPNRARRARRDERDDDAGTGAGQGGGGGPRRGGSKGRAPRRGERERGLGRQPKEGSRPGRNRSRNKSRPVDPKERPGGGVRRPPASDTE